MGASTLERAWERLGFDLRDAWRNLRSARETTAVAFAILTLTMAAGTVTFSVADAIALRPLPYASPKRLVSISPPSPTPGRFYPASPQDYFGWLEGTRTFESLGAAGLTPSLQLRQEDEVRPFRTLRITANLFDVLGVRPALGRFFGPEHERPGGPAVVILSHTVWVRTFGRDPAVVGRTLNFVHQPLEVIGILPEGVAFPISAGPEPECYVPYVPGPLDRVPGAPRRGFLTSVVGRLSPEVTVDQARADVNRVSGAVVVPLMDRVVGPARTWLLLVLTAVGIVLVVACANVATLFLARAAARAGELATREALGASRGRLAAGLLAEGLLLALASASAAVLLSAWGIDIAKSYLPPGLARVTTIAIDARVVGASLMAAVLAGLIAAGAPAWFAARSDLMRLMKGDGGRTLAGGRGRTRALGTFLIANVAFVCVLLVASSLVVASYIAITTLDLGFDRTNVMQLSYGRSLSNLAPASRPRAARALRAEVLARVRSVPGVAAAAVAQNASMPLSGGSVRYTIGIPGVGELGLADALESNIVSPGYFDALGMRLVRGRTLQANDGAGAPRVMVINEAATRRYFAGRDPVGQVVTFRGPTTIVGIVGDVRFDGPEAETRPAMFTPLDQEAFQGDRESGTLVVRAPANPRRLAAAVRDAIRAATGEDPGQAQFSEDYFRRTTADRRFNAILMAVFGLMAVAIGAIAVYGTMVFVVASQVHEIGVRMALGATRGAILHTVLRDALRRVTLGAALGLVGAGAVSSLLRSFVFGVSAAEPAVYVAVVGFLMLVGLAAALLPALRASRLDPLTALRRE